MKFESKKELIGALISGKECFYKDKVRIWYDEKECNPFRKEAMGFESGITNFYLMKSMEWDSYLPFNDKDLVCAWDDGTTHTELCFYDKKHDCAFSDDGLRNGYSFDNYEKANIEYLPKMVKKRLLEAKSNLEK